MNITSRADRFRDFQDEVLPLMEEGFRSVRGLLSMIMSTCPEFTQDDSEKIKKEILQASQCFLLAEKEAAENLEEVNYSLLQLTADKGRLQTEKGNRATELTSLKLQLNNNTEELARSRNQLEVARNDVRSKQQTLDEMRTKEKEADRNTKIGIGLMFIPFVGPLIGGTMIGVSQVDLKNAQKCADIAESVLKNAELHADQYEKRVADTRALVDRKTEKIGEVKALLEKIDRDINEVSRMLSVMSDVQHEFRNATHLLGQIAGSTQVLEVHAKHFILLEPLVMILADTVQKINQISENEKYRLLQVNEVTPLISYLNENLPRLKAICDQESLD